MKNAPTSNRADKSAKRTSNYNLATRLCKPALLLLLAVIYVPFYLALILSLPLLPNRLTNRLTNWLAQQGGM